MTEIEFIQQVSGQRCHRLGSLTLAVGQQVLGNRSGIGGHVLAKFGGVHALRQAGCDDVYEETASGKSADRPQLAECLRRLRRGDTLVVWKHDRLRRSLSDLVQIADRLAPIGRPEPKRQN